jgi:antitoxin FitA
MSFSRGRDAPCECTLADIAHRRPISIVRHIDMRFTCVHAKHMGIMVQIRNVPEALHRQLKSRAALAGMSLSDYLLDEIRQVAERPTIDELRARLRDRTEVIPSVAPADAVRAERDRA